MIYYVIRPLMVLFVFGSFLSACSSKIPYGSTYYFPLDPKPSPPKKIMKPEAFQASIEKLVPLKPSVAVQIKKANTKINQMIQPKTSLNDPQASHTSLSKKDQKKAIKTQIKALKSAVKQAKKQQKQEQQALTKNMRNGIILGVAGLIMMIIFGAAGIGILVGIGAVVLVVGIVLILLDLLEV